MLYLNKGDIKVYISNGSKTQKSEFRIDGSFTRFPHFEGKVSKKTLNKALEKVDLTIDAINDHSWTTKSLV